MNIWIAAGIYVAGLAVGAGVMYARSRREIKWATKASFLGGAAMIAERVRAKDEELAKDICKGFLGRSFTMVEDEDGSMRLLEHDQD